MSCIHYKNVRFYHSDLSKDETIGDLYIDLQDKYSSTPIGTIEDVIDGSECVFMPALIDLSTHATRLTDFSEQAKQAGIAVACLLPNSSHNMDSSAGVMLTQEQDNPLLGCRLLPVGALTQQLQGVQLSNMHALKMAGCVALSNSHFPIKSTLVLRRIMEYATTHDITVWLSPLDDDLANKGVMHEGVMSNKLGLAGIPETAETIALTQYVLLAESIGARIHISQISCARSVDIIKDAQSRGVSVTADVAIANLCYTDEFVEGYNSLFHTRPPLRGESDRKGLLAAVNEGVLAICSNHHTYQSADKKEIFSSSTSGMNSAFYWLNMGLSLIQKKELTLTRFIYGSCVKPKEILNRPLAGVNQRTPMLLVRLPKNNTTVNGYARSQECIIRHVNF
jgi:dihydroorotase